MRSILIIIFVIALSSVFSQHVREKSTFAASFEYLRQNILRNNPDTPFWNKVKSIDLDCVKERIKLTENSRKIINETVLLVLLAPTFGFCSGNIKDFAGLMVNELIYFFSPMGQHLDKVDCYKSELYKIEPDAEILKGFDHSKMTFMDEECDSVVEKESYEMMIDRNVEEVGDVDKFTCGLIKKDEIFKFLIKFPIIAYEQLDKEIENKVKKELTEVLAEKAEKLEECMNKLISNVDNKNEI